MNTELLEQAEIFLDYGVMAILGMMSLVTLWLFIERLIFFKTIRLESYKSAELLELDLTDNIGVISAIGSNAPYVGLLGTVLGIMITFYSLGDVQSVDPKQIMSSLALALKATALGLVVAIPAIVCYTYLLRKIEKILTRFEIANQEK